MRTCAECKLSKALSEFYKRTNTARCKACIKTMRDLSNYVERFER